MDYALSIGWKYFSFATAIMLVFSILKYRMREKYAQSLLNIPELSKNKLYKNRKRMTKYLKIFLCLSPLYIIFIPIILSYYHISELLVTAIAMLLMTALVWLEYLFNKWVTDYVNSKSA